MSCLWFNVSYFLTRSNAATSRVTCRTSHVAWRATRHSRVRCTAADGSATGPSVWQKAAAGSPALCRGQTAATPAPLPVIRTAAAPAPPAPPRYHTLPLTTAGAQIWLTNVEQMVRDWIHRTNFPTIRSFSSFELLYTQVKCILSPYIQLNHLIILVLFSPAVYYFCSSNGGHLQWRKSALIVCNCHGNLDEIITVAVLQPQKFNKRWDHCGNSSHK